MSDLTLTNFLAKLDASKGPDRSLDVDLFLTLRVNPRFSNPAPYPGAVLERPNGNFIYVPDYTNNLGATRELIEKIFPDAVYSSGKGPNSGKRKRKADGVRIPFDGYVASNDHIGEDNHYFGLSEGPTEAMAMVSALVKALIQKGNKNGNLN